MNEERASCMFSFATNSHNQTLIQLYRLVDARNYRLLMKVNNIEIMSFFVLLSGKKLITLLV